MLVLHPYKPGYEPARQLPTWDALSQIRRDGPWKVIDLACHLEDSYAEHLGKWAAALVGVIVVEQDIVPTFELVNGLVDCPEAFCAVNYPVSKYTTWASIPGALGLGLAKITTAAWEQVTEWPRVPIVHWSQVAGELAKRLPPVHVHRGQVRHNHPY